MAIIKYRKAVKPADVLFARQMAEFADFFTTEIPAALAATGEVIGDTILDRTEPQFDDNGNEIEVNIDHFDSVEQMQKIADAVQAVVPASVKEYNTTHGIKFYAKVVDADTGDVISDWTEV